MQDGTSNHTSQWQKPLFIEQDVVIFDWPGNSPDHNPIEHMWDLMKRRISNRRPFIKGRHELELTWLDEGKKLDIKKDINLFILNQMKRIYQVIAA